MINSRRRRGITEREEALVGAEGEEVVTYLQQEEEGENSGEMTIEVEMLTECHPKVIAKTVMRLVPFHIAKRLQTKDDKMAKYHNLPYLNKIKVNN